LIEITDERLTIISELLQSIREIKTLAWESYFLQRISEARQRELDTTWKKSLYSIANMVTMAVGPSITIALVLVIYAVVLGNTLTASVAFTTVSLLTILRFLIWRTPRAIVWAIQANASSQRISEFLALPENSNYITTSAIDDGDERIALENAEFRWLPADGVAIDVTGASAGGEMAAPFALRDINVSFVPGELNIIAGPTGSGKTSLLMALLGEMPRVHGTVHLPRHTIVTEFGTFSSNIAYVAQQAWIRNASVRDNILFGQPYEEIRYRRTLYACALENDIEKLAFGDYTHVGPRGVALTDSQKQRIALARAVYSPAHYVLLDDCLSALDVRTAKHIVDCALLGPLLQGRTRILVTNSVELCMNDAAFAVVLKDGRAVAQGPAVEVLPTAISIAPSSSGGTHSSAPKEGGAEASGIARSRSKEKQAAIEDAIYAELASSYTGATSSYHDEMLAKGDECAHGNSGILHCMAYVRFSGGYARWIAGILACLLAPALDVLQMYLLRMWADGTLAHVSSGVYTGAYGITIGFSLLVLLVFHLLFFSATWRASRNLHDSLISHVAGATPGVLDKTFVGHLLSQFSKDITAIDQELPESIVYFTLDSIGTPMYLIAVTILLPPYLIAVLVMVIAFSVLARRFLRTLRELKCVESTSKAPYMSLVSDALTGAVTIRAFSMEHWFAVESIACIDAMNRPIYLLAACNQWLASSMVWIASVAIAACCVLVIGFGHTTAAGIAGFALTYTLMFAESATWTVQDYGKMELAMSGMGRVAEHLHIKQERPAIIEDSRPPENWPQQGSVVIDQLTIRNAADQSPVLFDITLEVNPGEHVGIVGYAGAGKSTFPSAFLRFVEADGGRVVIDGIDISQIGLRDLRSRLTVISQESTLFSGTIRSNLDPLSLHDDATILAALRRCHLAEQGENEGGLHGSGLLDSPVVEGGINYSLEQRQLLVVARALLQGSRVIIVNETTTSMDSRLSSKAQEVIRNEFKHSTMLCIVNRLRTVFDYDRIMVLDAGRVIEYDTPLKLIRSKDSEFRKLCARAGKLEALTALISKEST
ncbi:P-loop containing nucleoside triphosphate hydrolase protein, partial [Thamnocephalis sphaerospora]